MSRTIPSQVDTQQASKSDQCVTHESDTAALGSAAEESYLGAISAQELGEMHHAIPCSRCTSILVVFEVSDLGSEACVSLHHSSEADL